ncbi:hypothetical protein PCE1_001419 [Barthelona sp. PCE]
MQVADFPPDVTEQLTVLRRLVLDAQLKASSSSTDGYNSLASQIKDTARDLLLMYDVDCSFLNENDFVPDVLLIVKVKSMLSKAIARMPAEEIIEHYTPVRTRNIPQTRTPVMSTRTPIARVSQTKPIAQHTPVYRSQFESPHYKRPPNKERRQSLQDLAQFDIEKSPDHDKDKERMNALFSDQISAVQHALSRLTRVQEEVDASQKELLTKREEMKLTDAERDLMGLCPDDFHREMSIKKKNLDNETTELIRSQQKSLREIKKKEEQTALLKDETLMMENDKLQVKKRLSELREKNSTMLSNITELERSVESTKQRKHRIEEEIAENHTNHLRQKNDYSLRLSEISALVQESRERLAVTRAELHRLSMVENTRVQESEWEQRLIEMRHINEKQRKMDDDVVYYQDTNENLQEEIDYMHYEKEELEEEIEHNQEKKERYNDLLGSLERTLHTLSSQLESDKVGNAEVISSMRQEQDDKMDEYSSNVQEITILSEQIQQMKAMLLGSLDEDTEDEDSESEYEEDSDSEYEEELMVSTPVMRSVRSPAKTTPSRVVVTDQSFEVAAEEILTPEKPITTPATRPSARHKTPMSKRVSKIRKTPRSTRKETTESIEDQYEKARSLANKRIADRRKKEAEKRKSDRLKKQKLDEKKRKEKQKQAAQGEKLREQANQRLKDFYRKKRMQEKKEREEEKEKEDKLRRLEEERREIFLKEQEKRKNLSAKKPMNSAKKRNMRTPSRYDDKLITPPRKLHKSDEEIEKARIEAQKRIKREKQKKLKEQREKEELKRAKEEQEKKAREERIKKINERRMQREKDINKRKRKRRPERIPENELVDNNKEPVQEDEVLKTTQRRPVSRSTGKLPNRKVPPSDLDLFDNILSQL